MSRRRGRLRPPRGAARPPARTGGSDRPRVRITSPSDLLAIIPYLIGFHPQESVVALFVRHGQVELAARMDLPPVEAADQLAGYWSTLAGQQGADRVGLVAYSADREPAVALLAALVARLQHHELADVLYADGARWWSITCQQSCCPPTGTPYSLDAHPVAAEAVLAGMAPQPDRAALVAMVAGPDPADLDRLDAVLDQVLADLFDVLQDQERAVKAVQTAVSDALVAAEITDEQCAVLALLCIDVVVRDHAWAMMSRENAEEHVRLWRQVVARVPDDISAAPLGLLGMAAWISGNGALLNCCAEQLSVVHPDYGLGEALAELSDRAIPPAAWDEWAVDFRASLQLVPG